jgi:fructose-bisphosphate aldolase class II
MVDHAYEHSYAVGAFELVNLEVLQGVMAAAERCRAPVILSLCETHADTFDFELLSGAVERAAERASVPVAIHFHHGRDLESAAQAINAGCNGVMVDGSERPLGENIEMTRKVVAMARCCGVPVEGILGVVPEAEGDGARRDTNGLACTSVAEARGFLDRTGVDFLAVAIGTLRGRTKAYPKLNWQRLKQINEALEIPLTIYGGTGLNDTQYQRLIANGVAKIGFYSGLVYAAFERLRASVKSNVTGSYASAMRVVQEAVEQETERCLRLCAAAGRAAEVLEQCRHWTPVDHVVSHEVGGGLDDASEEDVIAEGRRILGAIPGVRHVCSGNVARVDGACRYSWLVRFCHTAVVNHYAEHPTYVEFATRRMESAPRTRGDAHMAF